MLIDIDDILAIEIRRSVSNSPYFHRVQRACFESSCFLATRGGYRTETIDEIFDRP